MQTLKTKLQLSGLVVASKHLEVFHLEVFRNCILLIAMCGGMDCEIGLGYPVKLHKHERDLYYGLFVGSRISTWSDDLSG